MSLSHSLCLEVGKAGQSFPLDVDTGKGLRSSTCSVLAPSVKSNARGKHSWPSEPRVQALFPNPGICIKVNDIDALMTPVSISHLHGKSVQVGCDKYAPQSPSDFKWNTLQVCHS